MSSIVYRSYNMGGGLADYKLIDRFSNPDKYDQEGYYKGDEQELQPRRNAADQAATEAALKDECHVYCFQEVMGEERPLLTALREKNFKRVDGRGKYPWVSVFIDKNKFEDIEIGPSAQSYVVAYAKDRESGMRFAFASIWAGGFSLLDQENMAINAADGDQHCGDLADALEAVTERADHQIVCGDLNANPEIWKPRFNKFTDKGFTLQRTNQTTEVYPREPELVERELDYAFVRRVNKVKTRGEQSFTFLSSIFLDTFHYSPGQHNVVGAIGLNADENPSDHMMIEGVYNCDIELSHIKQLWRTIFG